VPCDVVIDYVIDADICPLARQDQRDAAANAFAGACNEDLLAIHESHAFLQFKSLN
jgi:hypothetical protein